MDDRERVLEVTKMKDAPSPEPMGFKLEQVTLPWLDEEGNSETSVVLVPTGAHVTPRKGKKGKLTTQQQWALEALRTAIKVHGVPRPWVPIPEAPEPVRVCNLEDWRTEFYATYQAKNPKNKEGSERKAFDRVIEALTDAQVVCVREDYYWPAEIRAQLEAAIL